MTSLIRRMAALWGDDATSRNRREFLPAALEIIETPASPTGRAMAMAIGAFFVLAVIWASFGKVDIIASAPGRLMPIGRTKVIQPLDPGVVRSIRVQDGDHVRAGQVLIELDPTEAQADQAKLAHDLELVRLDTARLNALKHSAETGGAPTPLTSPPVATPDDMAQIEAALRAQIAAQAAKVASLDGQIAEKRAEGQEAASDIARIKSSLPMLLEKRRLRQDLHDKGYATTFSYLDSQQAVTEAQEELPIDEAKAQQARAAAAGLEGQRAQATAEYDAGILADLAKAEEKENELTQELVKATRKSSGDQLVSPVDGVVQQLAVHTVGGVVTPAQPLLVIVPDDVGVTVEAQLANRDVGFVHPGQDVAIKVETFDFTHYGLIQGKVVMVSRDVVAPEEPASTSQDGSRQTASAAGAAGQANYVARISLDRTSMKVDGRSQPLTPGMSVVAEIKTGRRTIINYLFSPLTRKVSGSLHER